MSWGKIAISTRIGQKPDALFFKSWTWLCVGGLRNGDRVLSPAVELAHHYAAEFLALAFLETDADTLLMIDDDMIFTNNDLNQMRDDVEGFDYSVLQGLYLMRNPPHNPLIIKEQSDGLFAVGGNPPENAIVEVGIVGLGFTLIKRKALEDVLNKHGKVFCFSERGDGEDATFSMRSRALGHKLGVSTRVQIGHRFPINIKWNFSGNGIEYETLGQKNTKQ